MKEYFVIVNPIGHSLSPKLHNYWFKMSNINAVYGKKEINKEDLKFIISEIKEKKINGINVTVPFKKAVIPYLDKLTAEAEQTQSVNTIILNKNNLEGHNTDISGFYKAIKNINFNIEEKKVFILGAGGVVSSIVYALKKMDVAQITISNRTIRKAENLKTQFNNIQIVKWGDVPEFDVIINATSLGLKNETIDLDFSRIGKNKLFYDVIYNPKETNFLKIGKNSGNLAVNGTLMFIYQALEAFNLWHGIKPSINNETIRLLGND